MVCKWIRKALTRRQIRDSKDDVFQVNFFLGALGFIKWFSKWREKKLMFLLQYSTDLPRRSSHLEFGIQALNLVGSQGTLKNESSR